MKFNFKFLRNKNRMMSHKIIKKQMQNSYKKSKNKFKEKNRLKDCNQEIKH